MNKYPETFTFPGAFDFHTHLREPSPINKAETYLTGTQAAALAGNVAIADICNTPGLPTNTINRVWQKQRIARHTAHIPVGVWFGSQPEDNNIRDYDVAGHYTLGLKIFAHHTTGNTGHYEAEDFRENLTKWHDINPGLPVSIHSGGGNLEGFVDLAEEIDFHLHNFHTNDPADVEMMLRAQKRGVNITKGMCLHHVDFAAEEVEDWSLRMQPPLAKKVDREKLFYHLVNGDVEAFETDHAPHPQSAKVEADRLNPYGIEDANLPRSYGIRSLRVALPRLLKLFQENDVPLVRFVELTSTNPAKIMGVKFASTTEVTYLMEEYEITDDGPAPECAAPSPFIGRMALGKVLETKISGRKVIENGQLANPAPKLVKRGTEI
jgi:dihydroorotase-like cyclic amidohydrolase